MYLNGGLCISSQSQGLIIGCIFLFSGPIGALISSPQLCHRKCKKKFWPWLFFFSHTLRQQEKRSPSSPNISQTKDLQLTRQNVFTTGDSHYDYTASQAHIQWFKPQLWCIWALRIWELCYYSQWCRGLRKNLNFSSRSQTYELLTTSPNALPLSYRLLKVLGHVTNMIHYICWLQIILCVDITVDNLNIMWLPIMHVISREMKATDVQCNNIIITISATSGSSGFGSAIRSCIDVSTVDMFNAGFHAP